MYALYARNGRQTGSLRLTIALDAVDADAHAVPDPRLPATPPDGSQSPFRPTKSVAFEDQVGRETQRRTRRHHRRTTRTDKTDGGDGVNAAVKGDHNGSRREPPDLHRPPAMYFKNNPDRPELDSDSDHGKLVFFFFFLCVCVCVCVLCVLCCACHT